MKIWIDAQISPLIANWIQETFNFEAVAVRDIGLRDATDKDIFKRAKFENAIIITKDIDFKILQEIYGAPPKIIWLTCGNTSNQRLKEILKKNLKTTIELLNAGEIFVEISD